MTKRLGNGIMGHAVKHHHNHTTLIEDSLKNLEISFKEEE